MNEIHLDFEAYLTLAVLLTIVPWFYVKFKYRKSDKTPEGVAGHILSFAYSFFPVFFFVLLVRTFVFEPFRIPSSSMMPTLLTGDFIVVSKYSYGLKLPVLHDTIIEIGHPKRGDVAVFRYPLDQKLDYIKRVIGLPGDDVFYDVRTKHVYINGELIEQDKIGVYEGFLDDLQARNRVIEKTEQLGDQSHRMLTINGADIQNFQYTRLKVPEGHYFVMGDNRDNSADSRYWGLVPERNLVGRAEFIWMHWRTPHFFEGLKRIGSKII
ncbi:signal peptidase I [Marinicella gelatinilytica]|uniref:signal peptidase I n=1 Tax=Marinicella gelatinilytica TaxID=2996017 RepID=UPI002260B962|nr:signal peptidase I [Marinicella gelatinilytica]MCX7544624.1 signal peptidase I [Marinicella gelatinilytica]